MASQSMADCPKLLPKCFYSSIQVRATTGKSVPFCAASAVVGNYADGAEKVAESSCNENSPKRKNMMRKKRYDDLKTNGKCHGDDCSEHLKKFRQEAS